MTWIYRITHLQTYSLATNIVTLKVLHSFIMECLQKYQQSTQDLHWIAYLLSYFVATDKVTLEVIHHGSSFNLEYLQKYLKSTPKVITQLPQLAVAIK